MTAGKKLFLYLLISVLSLVVINAVARAQEYAVLNDADKGPGISLGSGGLSVAWSGLRAAVRGTVGKSDGTAYYEVPVVGVWDACVSIGVATSAHTLAQWIGFSATGWGYYGDGRKATGGSPSAYGDSYGNGDVIGVILDRDAGKIWFSKNGVVQGGGDPSAGTGAAYTNVSGEVYPAVSKCETATSTMTVNFGQSVFNYAVPVGFATGWFPTPEDSDPEPLLVSGLQPIVGGLNLVIVAVIFLFLGATMAKAFLEGFDQ